MAYLYSAFYIVRLQYYDGGNFDASDISFLSLKREPANEFDGNAIEVYHKQLKIGYIPKVENKIIAKSLSKHHYQATCDNQ